MEDITGVTAIEVVITEAADECVGAGLSVEGVIPITTIEGIGGITAIEMVVAGAAEECVLIPLAVELVVTGAAV